MRSTCLPVPAPWGWRPRAGVRITSTGLISIVRALRESARRSRDSVPTKQARVADAFRFLQDAPRSYDVIFIDPPFSLDMQVKAARAALGALKEEGLLYVESPTELLSDEALESLGVVRVRSGSAGAVRFELLAKAGSGMAGLVRRSKEEKRSRK